MRDFTVNDSQRSRSIGFDATDRQGTVVTVGVLVNRTQEATLLDDLYQTFSTCEYRPFQTKSQDLSLPPEDLFDIALKCNGDIGICVHQDDVTLPYAEAVHSAILLDQLDPPTRESVVIADGNQDRADKLYRAATALDVVPPAIANCVQSELYYPHLLLADLLAGTVADLLNEPDRTLPEPGSATEIPTFDTTRQNHSGSWGRGYAAVARDEGDVERARFEQRYAHSVKERVACWHSGTMGKRHAPAVESDGITPVAKQLEAMGCTDVAQWIIEQ